MREVGRGGRSPARTTHLVEEGELSPAAAVQVEAGVAGGVQPAVPGEGVVPQHLGGIWGEDGQEVAAFAEVSGAPPQGCVALVLEVLEGGGAVGGAEGDGHAGNMAFVPERTGQGGRGRAPGQFLKDWGRGQWAPLVTSLVSRGFLRCPPSSALGEGHMREVLGLYLPTEVSPDKRLPRGPGHPGPVLTPSARL